MTSHRRALFVCVLSALATTVAAQAPSTPPGDVGPRPAGPGGTTITGQVTRVDTGEPVRGASVSIAPVNMRDFMSVGPDGMMVPVSLPEGFTDDTGRFELQAVPAGRFHVTASKTGFVSQQYGQRRPHTSGQSIQAGATTVIEQVNVALTRGAVIGGRVLDERGDPVAGAAVRIMRQRFVAGRPELVPAGSDVDLTDDLGEFRVHGLPPGTYFVEASGPPSEEAAFTGFLSAGSHATYFPSALSVSDATPVRVGVGEEAAALTVMMRAPIASDIVVVVRTADGQPASGVSVEASTSLGAGAVGSVPSRPQGDGVYVVPNVSPGTYAILARGTDGTVARAQLRVDGGNLEVPLTLTPGATLRGRVSFGQQRSLASVDPRSMRVVLSQPDPHEGRMPEGGIVRDDWTFEVAHLVGRARVRVVAPDGWAVESIRSGDADVTDAVLDFSSGRDIGIDVILTNRVTEVSGSVRDDRGRVVSDATVMLFAEDRSKWGPYSRFLALVSVDETGRFNRRGLPPGRYLAVALDYAEDGEETNLELLERLQASATRVNLVEGETREMNLPITK